MDERSRSLEDRLNAGAPSWADDGGHGSPAPAFIGAVRRRRTARRVRSGAVVAVLALLAGGAVWMLRTQPSAGGSRQLVAEPGHESPAHPATNTGAQAMSQTFAVLTADNREMPSDPVLPEIHGSRRGDRTLTLMDSRNPAAFEGVFGGV